MASTAFNLKTRYSGTRILETKAQRGKKTGVRVDPEGPDLYTGGLKEANLSVLTEERLIQFLRQTIDLESECLDRLIEEGTRPVPVEILERYQSLVRAIEAEKGNDPALQQETWNWIWSISEGMNLIQLNGRLAWINYHLLDLL